LPAAFANINIAKSPSVYYWCETISGATASAAAASSP
jgi:hypothetical protein